MRLGAFLLTLALTIPAVAQTAVPSAPASAPAWAEGAAARADEYLTAWTNAGRFSGTVLIAKDGKVLLRKSYGMANQELGVPSSPEMIYRIGSITKTFTALSILQLEEKGKLSVQDPVVKYVPEVPQAWQKITIDQLLSHTSGIPQFMNAAAYQKADDPLRVEKALQDYSTQPLLSAPGEKFAYSNSGYVLLGRVIEKLSGMTYEQYLDSNILKPAGLENTGYDHGRTILKNRASGYIYDGDHLANAYMGEMTGPHSAGALHSTVDDLYNFDQVLTDGKLFSKTLLEKAMTPRVKWVNIPPFNIDAMYCYGWMKGENFGHLYFNHGGWVDGFITQFWRYPQDKMTVVLLANIESPHIIAVQEGVTAAIFGQPYTLPKFHKRVEVPRSVLERYVGTYAVMPGLDVKVYFEGDRLFAQGTNQPMFQMLPESETDFYFAAIESLLHFDVNAQGQANKLIVRLQGQEMVGTRK
jgi:CubicO group peptidase (beta-lactamase class C family)